jgi:hypothetical protein
MLATLRRVATYGVIALGAVHTVAARCYGELSPDAVWFAGSGLALVFLGLLNVAADATATARAWVPCRIGNVLGVAFGAPAAIAVGEPQGYVGLIFLVALAVTSFVSAGEDASLKGAARWLAVGVFALFAAATTHQLVGCVADGHPWFQIATWALLLPAFAFAAWRSLPRIARS